MRLGPRRGAALTSLALCAGYVALALRLEDAVRAPVFVLGPRSFPLLVGAAGIVVSILLLIERFPTAGDPGATLAEVDAAVAATPTGDFAGDWRRTLGLCALMLVYAAALPRAGFTLSTAAFLAASFRLLGERRAVALAVVPIAVAVAALVLLRGGFGAHLPEPWLDAVLR
jgi:hypothetical protein